MKKCPKCEAVVDAIAECPVCGNGILNQPQEERKIEKYKLNKWFFLHLISHNQYYKSSNNSDENRQSY